MPVLTPEEVFRDFETDGVPDSGAHKVKKSEARQYLRQIQDVVDAFMSNGGLIFVSRASLDEDLAHDAGAMAWVIGDSTVSNNGIYRKIGSSGSGSWSRAADLPYSFIQLVDVGAGAPNAIVATSSISLSATPYRTLLVLNVFEANTGAVTLAVNGEAARPLVSLTGSALAGGALQPSSAMLVVDDGSNFRILTDYDSGANLAAAELVRDETETLRNQAQQFRDDAQLAAQEAAEAADGAILGSTGSNDNAVLRADGTDEKTAQGSPVTISDTGDMEGVAALTMTGLLTTAGQVAFPATAAPSADPNTLDDYEEGSWTPDLNFGGAAVGMTYATQVGRYTKVGRTVTVHGAIVLTLKGSSAGAATIAGLPFTSANDAIPAAASIGFASGLSMMSGAIIATIAANASRLTLYQSASGSAAAISSSNFSNSAQLVFSASYDV